MLVIETSFITVLVIISLFGSILIERKAIKHVHESALFIIIGVLGSYLVKVFTDAPGIEFNSDVFFTIILPPIIFAAGYTLRAKEFFENFKYISLFGIYGTLVAFVILSLLSLVANHTLSEQEQLSLSDCMMLACILCSTDTVAALSLVKAEEYPKLNAILFGEGIINDAISILLFRTIKNFFLSQATGGKSEFSVDILLSIAGDFAYLSFFSLLIGISCGLLLSLMFKNVHDFAEKPKLETSLILLISYSSYLLAEGLHFSGIMSLFSCGLIMAHYTYQNISANSQQGTILIFDAFGYLAETFVFIYLGFTIVSFEYTDLRIFHTLFMILSVFIARFVAIFVLPGFMYIIRCPINLELKEMKIIWYSGLVRGAISFGLGWLVESKNKKLIQSTTLGVVIFTIFVLTNLLELFAKKIGLNQNMYTDVEDMRNMLMPNTLGDEVSKDHKERIRSDIQLRTYINENYSESSKPGKIQKTFMDFESKYVQPIFGAKNIKSPSATSE